jgi:hypothetical protein
VSDHRRDTPPHGGKGPAFGIVVGLIIAFVFWTILGLLIF